FRSCACVAAVLPLLVDAGDEEDLVVHREPEHDREDHDRDNASIGPGWTPIRPASQPRSKIAWTTPRAAAIESRFISAACSGINSERKTTSRSSAESSTTRPMKSGSLPDRTCAKSTWVGVPSPR